ncbi:hypothetical protein CHLRE_12g523026v5 [Chlamydomonas reinhardtii]|uniref:Uncharacterized protein n=1 Tax=Chlamydomonas reinhardtii TaxID=3055 RepID=A0A2K3D490_CHLRE|nr:uncharacterized protein CHLRE_12g523026v5 [Chlamydomonas reinhardtii]PNW75337.1 hypothetical protein CHLRE_12g523026v5 [Chlamydomonas reinhardtii]
MLHASADCRLHDSTLHWSGDGRTQIRRYAYENLHGWIGQVGLQTEHCRIEDWDAKGA